MATNITNRLRHVLTRSLSTTFNGMGNKSSKTSKSNPNNQLHHKVNQVNCCHNLSTNSNNGNRRKSITCTTIIGGNGSNNNNDANGNGKSNLLFNNKSKFMIGFSAAIGLYGYHQFKMYKRMSTVVRSHKLDDLNESSTTISEEEDDESKSSHKTIFCDLIPTVHAAKGIISETDARGSHPGQGHGVVGLSNKKLAHNFIADAVELTLPAVVFIETITFHPFYPNMILAKSGGSGFFITKDGLVLTNAHVVSNNMTVTIRTSDGMIYKDCPVEAIDTSLDLATVRVPLNGVKSTKSGHQVSTIKLADSSSCRPGEFVVALGSPYSLTNTITSGIISSMSRKSSEIGLSSNINYIQTDASINIGNSGGPLIDLNGEAIGINSMRVTDGIAFAIPSDVAIRFLKDVYGNDLSSCPTIKENKRERKSDDSSSFGSESKRSSSSPIEHFVATPKRRKFLGIVMLTMNEQLIRQLIDGHGSDPRLQHLENVTNGVLILKVTPASPAFVAGLQVYDVITEIDGVNVTSSDDVYKCLEISDDDGKDDNLKPIKLTVLREGLKVTLIVKPQ